MDKRIKFVFLFVLIAVMICVVFLVCSVVFADTELDNGEGEVAVEQRDWQKYIEEKIVPGVILVVTAIGSIYIAIAPILSKVKKASGSFESATKDVNAATNKTIDSEKKVAGFEKRLARIEKVVTNIEDISRIAFCNTEELVRKGYANEISKVGGNNEEKEIEA